jgi:hypothetical protein
MVDRDDAWTARRKVFLTENAQGRFKPGNGEARVVPKEAGAGQDRIADESGDQARGIGILWIHNIGIALSGTE